MKNGQKGDTIVLKWKREGLEGRRQQHVWVWMMTAELRLRMINKSHISEAFQPNLIQFYV